MVPKRAANGLALLVLISTLLSFFQQAFGLKHEIFKTCDQSGFCKRNRAYAESVAASGSSFQSPYRLDPSTIRLNNGKLYGTILKTIGSDGETVDLPLVIHFQEPGVVRMTVDEAKRQQGDIALRHDSQARKERYNEVSSWAIVAQPKDDATAKVDTKDGKTTVTYGGPKAYKAIVNHSPFQVDFLRDDQIHISINADNLFNMEHWRAKVDKPEGQETPQASAAEDESTWWDETFGGNTDSKPRGPESVGIDIKFPGYEHVYGIPGHASSLSLKQTKGASGGYEEPYRLYNADVFEYEMDSPATMYGAITLMEAHRKGSSVGIFWMNAAETWIDITKEKTSSNPLSLGTSAATDTKTHWISESGLLDIFVFLGPNPKDIVGQYSALTGYTQLPQQFAIGHHQCRWNYVTDEDVKDVDKKMTRADIPYDVIWLDIEYTDGKKYFTWDGHTFPDPLGMQKQLDLSQRKLVIIIDPHIKNEENYPVIDQLKSKDLAVHNKDNNLYEGWCWPGSSHWVDCFNPGARSWWSALFNYNFFKGTTTSTHIWNDMNEPSVFNGPETSMPKDNLHFENWEHRDVHNLNGMTFVNATYEALLARDNYEKRPFVLTRSYFAGSQRLGAMWTGDNQASWDHLAASIPMTLSLNIAGFPFAGADVGGFFGNPSKELLTRWYQAGAFYPFFRAHAHIDTRRREPYLIGQPYTQIMTQALRLRYSLLPAWYTAFHTASATGSPVIRPHYYVHPDDEAAFGIDDQLFVGDTGLLAKPVVTEGATSVDIYLPPDQLYFDYFSYKRYPGQGKTVKIDAPLDQIPLLMEAGHIIPRKDRPRRSSSLMKYDPYTLVIVLNAEGTAEGELYIDDGESFEYRKGAFIHRQFKFFGGSLASTSLPNDDASNKEAKKFLTSMKDVRVERVIVVNAPSSWKEKSQVSVVESGAKKSVTVKLFDGANGGADWAVVQNPNLAITADWSVQF